MSSPRLYKYSGAGNDFIVLSDGIAVSENAADGSLCSQGLPEDAGAYRDARLIERLCDRRDGLKAADGRTGADGLMILSRPDRPGCDFRMEYFNSDGSGGMMCGNGGRCIAAFADFLGIRPADGKNYLFEAPDGQHSAEILSREGSRCTVRLKMIDAFGLRRVLGGWFLNTGTRHFVLFTDDAEAVDVEKDGRRLRHDPEFAPEGANVNFVSRLDGNLLKIRTFEKGVEAETLACGTGITAAAIAAYYEGIAPAEADGKRVKYRLQARTDLLSVDFIPSADGACGTAAAEVFLTGPAERIYSQR